MERFDGKKLVIDNGTCLRVGDGMNIDVARDPWIPFLPNFFHSSTSGFSALWSKGGGFNLS